MIKSQTLGLRVSELRSERDQLADKTDILTDVEIDRLDHLRRELRSVEAQQRAAVAAEDVAAEDLPAGEPPTSEQRELRELRSEVSIGRYMLSAADSTPLIGAERDYNQALGVADRPGQFPLSLLAPEREFRTETDIDPNVNSQTWLDRLMAASAATYLGVTMRNVPAGVASFPIMVTGAGASQEARDEAKAASAWTFSAAEAVPKRQSTALNFTIEDAARIGGELEAALLRDMRNAMVEDMDRTIFLGDSTPAQTDADIAGLQGLTGVVTGSITQSNKVSGNGVGAAFAGLVDGVHALQPSDLNVVTSVAAGQLWWSTKSASGNAADQSIAQYLNALGVTFRVRAGIEDSDTANADRAAIIGRSRGIEGAAVAAVWENATLVRDVYTDARSGGVRLTMHTLWDFVVPRPSNFATLGFVT